jgi:hypothetical protein
MNLAQLLSSRITVNIKQWFTFPSTAKGGVYGVCKTREGSGGTAGRPVEPLEGGTAVASNRALLALRIMQLIRVIHARVIDHDKMLRRQTRCAQQASAK